ncbi:MAG TPA: hypothetical protein VH880_06180 [Anaeromyxobacteraceae bacterium]
MARAAALLALGVLACSGAPPRPGAAAPRAAWAGVTPGDATRLRERFGLELLGLRAVSAGYLLELRCLVLHADRAAPLVEGRVPVLLAGEGGRGADARRPGRPVAEGPPEERRLTLFLAPSGAPVASGARVDLTFGDLAISGLPVE